MQLNLSQCEDTRVVYVQLTSEGYELEPLFERISEEVLEAFYKNISEQEKKVLVRILNKIDNNL